MAKPKKIAAKSKAKTSKYTKLMKAASKELADKKKALAKAEKTLATATKNHQELLQETARLDMLERSLKALVEGTEPPQNVRYVYTYPQWVWTYPSWYTYPYNGTYTITLGNAQTSNSIGNLQGGQVLTATNSTPQWTTSNTTETNCINTVGTTTGALSTAYCQTSGYDLSGGNVGTAGQVLGNGQWQTIATTNMPTADITVDLSTGATEDGACTGYCEPACATCAVDTVEVGS